MRTGMSAPGFREALRIGIGLNVSLASNGHHMRPMALSNTKSHVASASSRYWKASGPEIVWRSLRSDTGQMSSLQRASLCAAASPALFSKWCFGSIGLNNWDSIVDEVERLLMAHSEREAIIEEELERSA